LKISSIKTKSIQKSFYEKRLSIGIFSLSFSIKSDPQYVNEARISQVASMNNVELLKLKMTRIVKFYGMLIPMHEKLGNLIIFLIFSGEIQFQRFWRQRE